MTDKIRDAAERLIKIFDGHGAYTDECREGAVECLKAALKPSRSEIATWLEEYMTEECIISEYFKLAIEELRKSDD